MLDFDVFNECVTNRPTDQPRDTASYRGALSHLKRSKERGNEWNKERNKTRLKTARACGVLRGILSDLKKIWSFDWILSFFKPFAQSVLCHGQFGWKRVHTCCLVNHFATFYWKGLPTDMKVHVGNLWGRISASRKVYKIWKPGEGI